MPSFYDDWFNNVSEVISPSTSRFVTDATSDKEKEALVEEYFTENAKHIYDWYHSKIRDKAEDIWYNELKEKENIVTELRENMPSKFDNIISFGKAGKEWAENLSAAQDNLKEHIDTIGGTVAGLSLIEYASPVRNQALRELNQINENYGFDYDILLKRPDAAKLVIGYTHNPVSRIDVYQRMVDEIEKQIHANDLYAKAKGLQSETKSAAEILEERLPGVTEIYKEAVNEKQRNKEEHRQQLREHKNEINQKNKLRSEKTKQLQETTALWEEAYFIGLDKSEISNLYGRTLHQTTMSTYERNKGDISFDMASESAKWEIRNNPEHKILYENYLQSDPNHVINEYLDIEASYYDDYCKLLILEQSEAVKGKDQLENHEIPNHFTKEPSAIDNLLTAGEARKEWRKEFTRLTEQHKQLTAKENDCMNAIMDGMKNPEAQDYIEKRFSAEFPDFKEMYKTALHTVQKERVKAIEQKNLEQNMTRNAPGITR